MGAGPNTCDSRTIPPDRPHLQQPQQLHGAAPLHIHDAIPNASTDQWAPRRLVCIQTAGAYSTSISPRNNQTPQSSPRSVNSADARSKTAAGGVVVAASSPFTLMCVSLARSLARTWSGDGGSRRAGEGKTSCVRGAARFSPAAERNPCLISPRTSQSSAPVLASLPPLPG